jgi:hypothetical protein
VKRRQEIAKRRAKLGFNDNGATEMEDPAIAKIEYLKKLNMISVTEASDRVVRVPTEVQGITA